MGEVWGALPYQLRLDRLENGFDGCIGVAVALTTHRCLKVKFTQGILVVAVEILLPQ